LKKTVGDIVPCNAHIGGLPESATGGAHIVDHRVSFYTGSTVGAATTEGSDIPPFNGFEDGVVIGAVFFGLGERELADANEDEQ
jgi:hypothetical protein